MNELITEAVLARNEKRKAGNTPLLHPSVEKIVKELAAEYGVSKNEVRKVVTTPYQLWKDVRTNERKFDGEKGFPTMRIPYIGVFAARFTYIDSYLAKKKGE